MFSWFSNGSLQTSCLCEFHASSITFLSFVVQQGQLFPAPTKVCAVTEWFLDFVNHYSCFFHYDRKVVAPLGSLMSTLKSFLGTNETKAAFTVLVHPHSGPAGPQHLIIIGFGASNIRISAIPSQLISQNRSSIPEPLSAGNWLWLK